MKTWLVPALRMPCFGIGLHLDVEGMPLLCPNVDDVDLQVQHFGNQLARRVQTPASCRVHQTSSVCLCGGETRGRTGRGGQGGDPGSTLLNYYDLGNFSE